MAVLFLFFLPHLSINFVLMAYIDRFAHYSSPESYIRRLNQLKMIPRMISFILLFSCVGLACILIMFISNFHTKPNGKTIFHIVCTLYVITTILIPSVLLLVLVLLPYRNTRRRRQQTVSLLFLFENGKKMICFSMQHQPIFQDICEISSL